MPQPSVDPVLATIIAEAANQGPEGMYAVASVLVNRAARRRQTLEQVVNAPKQFTGRWRKDLATFVAKQGPEMQMLAQQALAKAQAQPLPGVDLYVTTDLFKRAPPSWAKTMGGRKVIGGHIFFDSAKGPEEARLSGDPLEQKLRHMYRMTAAAGFSPMTATEIEPILARETVPTAVPGVQPTPPDEDEQERQAIAATNRALRSQAGGVGPRASSGAGAALGGLG